MINPRLDLYACDIYIYIYKINKCYLLILLFMRSFHPDISRKNLNWISAHALSFLALPFKSKYPRERVRLTSYSDRVDKPAFCNNSSTLLKLSTAPYRTSARHNNADTFARFLILAIGSHANRLGNLIQVLGCFPIQKAIVSYNLLPIVKLSETIKGNVGIFCI